MPSSHASLVKLGQQLGHKLQSGGCCQGIVLAILQQYLIKKDDYVRELVKIASEINPDSLVKQIEFTKENVKLDNFMTPRSKKLLDLSALMNVIELYQSPYYNYSLFNKPVLQKDIHQLSQYASSKEIEALGGLTTHYLDRSIHTKITIKKLFDTIRACIDYSKYPFRIAFVLSEPGHTCGLGYNPKTKLWTYIDSNQWENYLFTAEATDLLAKRTMAGFKKVGKNTVFSTTMVIPTAYEKQFHLSNYLNIYKNDPLIEDVLSQNKKAVESLIYLALVEDDETFINKLAKKGYQFATMQFYNEPFINLAAELGCLKTFKVLEKYGANLEKTLVIAACAGHDNLIQYLIEKKNVKFSPAVFSIQVFLKVMSDFKDDRILQRANQLIQAKTSGSSDPLDKTSLISITAHEIAVVLGYEKVIQVFDQQKKSQLKFITTPFKQLKFTIAPFKKEKEKDHFHSRKLSW